MAAEHWFRWHHGTVTDPKWRIVAKRASHAMSRNVTVGHVVSVWAAMLENASQSSPRGDLTNWSDEDIGVALDIEQAEVAAIREAMEGKTLESDAVIAWNRRQIRREDDTAAQRKAAQREREKSQSKNVTKRDKNESHTSSHNVPVETETETETEKEEREKPNAPASPPLTPGSTKSDKPKRESGQTLAAWLDSLPPDEMAIPADDPVYAYAERVGLPEDFLTLQWAWFKSKYLAETKTRQKDWRLKFRNAVEGGWGNHWRIDHDGAYYLTTQGKQLERSLAEVQA